jgi:FkbH-like protein
MATYSGPSHESLAPLVISATFTAQPLAEALEFWISELRLPWRIEFAPFNQVFQSLIHPGSSLGRNTTGVNVILVRLEELAGQQTAGQEIAGQNMAGQGDLLDNVRALGDAIQAFASRNPRPLQVVLTPGGKDWSKHHAAEAAEAGHRIREACALAANVDFADGYDDARAYHVPDLLDEGADRLGKVPYRAAYFAALATGIVRRADLRLRPPFKVIAVDCDNTLWTGICGEDGPQGVRITPARRHLQEFLLAQREAGMVLVIASKNNEPDVWETFAAHPSMPLQRDHFAAWRIDWHPKANNLPSLARELNVGLDSFVFLDDSPLEVAAMREQAPEVASLELPHEEDRIPSFLAHAWAFDHARITAEDQRRSESYRQQAARTQAARELLDPARFLEELRLELRIGAVRESEWPRVAQLFQRTNQMNTSAMRWSETELRGKVASGDWECLAASASDRFGDYGLIGVALIEKASEAWRIDSLLLSCRAFGRGIEHAILREVASRAQAVHVPWIDVQFRPTAKNRPAAELLASLPATVVPADDASLYRAATADLRTLTYEPESMPEAEAERPASLGGYQALDYGRIALRFADAEAVLQALGRKRERSREPGEEPLPGTEAEIAALWQELLKVAHVGRQENFFDLGGHSLLAVQLLARMNERFQVELSLEVIYESALTVADLARTVELAQLGSLSPEEYAALLAEVESLSDEEARELLEREGPVG